MLVTDQQQISQAPIGHQQNRLTGALKQSIGGNGGAQPQFLDQSRLNRLVWSKTHQLAHGRHGRVPGHTRLLGKNLPHHQPTGGMTRHQIGERAATVNPELPAVQDNCGRWAPAASSTQRCTLEWR